VRDKIIPRVTAMKPPPIHTWVSKKRLEQLYVQDGLTTVEVAARLGTNRESVRKLIYRYALPMRLTSGRAKPRRKYRRDKVNV
jgi:hypothetical protein